MKTEKRKAIKPRSTRYFDEQEKVFIKLEQMGVNVSHLLRKAADIVIKENEYIVSQQPTK